MKKIRLSIIASFLLTFSLSGQSIALYDISVTTVWNNTNHTSVPTSPAAHWSALSGATHKNPNDILVFGAIAPTTDGIKDIAEIGDTTKFEAEITANANANQYLEQGFSPYAGNDSNATLSNISVNENFPYITLVSMVAPSPDWFIAVNSENLRSGNNTVNNGWKDTYTIMNVYAYDAGTDSGIDYTSDNLITNPRQPITIVSGVPINGNSMATITFTYKSSTLNTTDFNSIENIKIYPNPTKEHVTISNSNNIELKNIEIYTVLGNLVKQIPLEKTAHSIDLNLSYLNTGIYILKLNTFGRNSRIQKLFVE